MREWLDAVVAVLFAPVCGACARPLPHPTRGCICDDCWCAVTPYQWSVCTRCGESLDAERTSPPLRPLRHGCAVCVGANSAVDEVRAIGPYNGTLRDIVHALKYDGRRSVATTLARLMSAAAPEFIANADAVVPVPLHPVRRRARGFNQANDLARALGPPVVHALRRIRATPSQTTLPSDERHINVDGAFAPTRHLRTLAGRTVLLVDDVRTTGATLNACAKVLKAKGVATVWAITAARVATPRG